MINQQIQQILQQQKKLQEALERCLSQVKIEDHADNDNQQSDQFNEKIDGAFLNDFEVKDHYLFSFDNHIKNDYVYVLLEVLKSSSGISKTQYTLLSLLLKSMRLEHESQFYFESIKVVDSDLLERLADCVKIDSEIGSALIADILILFRSVGVLDNSKINVISRLLDLFGLSPYKLMEIDNIASSIIGTSSQGKFWKIVLEENITCSDEENLRKEGLIITDKKCKILQVYGGRVRKGYVVIDILMTAKKVFDLKTYSSFGGKFSGISKVKEKEGFFEEKRYVYALQTGYFAPRVSVGEDLSGDHKIHLGDIVVVPKYLNFWYSFIDLEAMIKESL